MARYQSLINTFTEDELSLLAQLKRLFERIQCDRELMEAFNKNNVTTEQLKRLKETGIVLDLSDFPLSSKRQNDVILYVLAVSKDSGQELSDEVKQIAEQYPLLKLWGKYSELINKDRKSYIGGKKDKAESLNPKFNEWRKRRIAATKSELGFFGTQISHPAFAYELCKGCSVGCWFCSFSANRLTGVFDYGAGCDSVHSIIRHNIDIFGKETACNALPYYGTEPHDNPGYIPFLQDFEKLTGGVLCTSTAYCNDIDWLRELMKYYDRRDIKYNWPRLSILSQKMIDKVHDAFSPMELLHIELLIQVKDNVRPKVTGGRILKEQAGLRSREDFSEKNNIGFVPQGSIACVSGFNINLVSKTVTLFSPCYVCNRWPHGFRIFGQASYNDASDYPEAIHRLIDSCMYLSPPKDKIIKFRDDIIFRPTEAGFDLATPNQLHHFKGKSKYGPLGQLIANGTFTYTQVLDILQNEHRVNPIVTHAVVQQIFNDGYIDEIYTTD